MTNNNLGLALSKNGHPKLAEVVFGDAAEIQWGLLATDPGNITYLGTLGGICNNLGMVREQTKDLEGAAVAYSEALESQEKALKAAPDNKTLRGFLSRTCFNYSRVCQQTGNIDTAIKTTIRRRELWEHDSEHLLSIAREFAEASRICSEGIANGAEACTAEECLRLAAESLRMAADAGLARLTSDDAAFFVQFRQDTRLQSTVSMLTSHTPLAINSTPK